MDNSRRARENAEALMPGPEAPHRSEKGTAGLIIAAETAARHSKTERLKAARLAQEEAAVVSEPVVKPARAKQTTKAAAAKTTTAKAAPKARKKAAASAG